MAIETITVKFKGFSPLLQNNPRGINPLDPYTKADAAANLKYKKSKTDENFNAQVISGIALRTFWDDDLGVYIPTKWAHSSLAGKAYSLLGRGYSKGAIRGAVFTVTDKVKLHFDGEDKVKTLTDVTRNDKFHTMIYHTIGANKVAKSMPIFHDWWFEVEFEYDTTIIDADNIMEVLSYTSKYGGFGDFRPSYGRALCEVVV